MYVKITGGNTSFFRLKSENPSLKGMTNRNFLLSGWMGLTYQANPSEEKSTVKLGKIATYVEMNVGKRFVLFVFSL